MKKLFIFSLVLFSYVANGQQIPPLDVKKVVDNKSFVFVATASFGGRPEVGSFWETVYAPAPMSVLSSNASISTFLNIVSWPPDPKIITTTKTEEYPIVYVQEGSALFHPSMFQRAFDQLKGRNPDSLNNPLVIKNYTIKKNKKGKIFVNFKVDVDKFNDQAVKLTISPDGKAEMWIATSIINRNRYPQSYKGYIQELTSL